MKLGDLIFSIGPILYSISFSWVIAERINKYPNLRRFGALSQLLKYKYASFKDEITDFPDEKMRLFIWKRECSAFRNSYRHIKVDAYVLGIGWGILFVSLFPFMFSLHQFDLMKGYIEQIHSFEFFLGVIILFTYLIMPQLVSRALTSFIMWRVPDSVIYTKVCEPELFEGVFSKSWQQTVFGNHNEKLVDKEFCTPMAERAISSWNWFLFFSILPWLFRFNFFWHLLILLMLIVVLPWSIRYYASNLYIAGFFSLAALLFWFIHFEIYYPLLAVLLVLLDLYMWSLFFSRRDLFLVCSLILVAFFLFLIFSDISEIAKLTDLV